MELGARDIHAHDLTYAVSDEQLIVDNVQLKLSCSLLNNFRENNDDCLVAHRNEPFKSALNSQLNQSQGQIRERDGATRSLDT